MTRKIFTLRNLLAIAICLAAVTMFMGCDKEPPIVTLGNEISNAIDAFEKVPLTGKKQDIVFAAGYANGSTGIHLVASSHLQGYARYRGVSNGKTYDYHILSHSHLTGKQGHVWFISDDGNHKFYMKFALSSAPGNELKDNQGYYYNHPAGLQIIDDYLIVPVIPAWWVVAPFFNPSAIIYVVDLSKLKDVTKLKDGTDIVWKYENCHYTKNGVDLYYTLKEIMLDTRKLLEIPGVSVNGTSGNFAGSVSAAGITRVGNTYTLGIMADETLELHQFNGTSIWDIASNQSSTPVKTYNMKNKRHYQSIGLFTESTGNMFMIGFDRRSGDDYADLYQLSKRENGKDVFYGTNKVAEIDVLKDKNNKYLAKHVTLSGGSHFDNGAGMEIRNDKLILYATEKYTQDGDATINILEKP